VSEEKITKWAIELKLPNGEVETYHFNSESEFRRAQALLEAAIRESGVDVPPPTKRIEDIH
jgi:hypothetical protein